MTAQGQLFGRSFRVTLQDKQFGSFAGDIRPLSFAFSVQRDKTLTPNNANILLYNLSADTRSQLEQLSGGFGQGTGRVPKTTLHSAKTKKETKRAAAGAASPAPQDFGVTVRLEAGYGEHIGQLFFGVLRKVSSWRQGPDWLTQISGGDAEQSITTAKISRTWVAGTPISTIVRDMVSALGVGQGGLVTTLRALDVSGFLSSGTKLNKALTAHGDAATELDQLMRSCGFEWSIQDMAFYAGPTGTATFPGEGPLLTPETGLIDEPQIDRSGNVVGKALLNPDLLPGRTFRVGSSRVTGNFLCVKTQHKGTSDGTEWYVEWVGSPPQKNSKAALLAAALGDTGFATP